MGKGSGSAGIRDLYSKEYFMLAFRCQRRGIGSLRLEASSSVRQRKKRATWPAQNCYLWLTITLQSHTQECDPLAPLGEATGGHALPGAGLVPGLPGEVPASFPWLFPLPEFDPEFGAVPELPSVVPGRVPQGVPLGEPPGLFGVLGLTVEGCVGVPGVGVAGELDPGTVGFGVPLGDEDPGEFGF